MRMRKKAWADPFLQEQESFVIAHPDKMAGNWKTLIQKEQLHVEIGSGKGDYFTKMAQLHPECGWIGIEKNRNVAAIAVKKALNIPCDSMRFIALDADRIETWFKPGEVDVIHLNFSDPWPKRGNAKRRLSHAKFLKRYENLLACDGQVIMKTDNQGLFEFSLIEFSASNWKLMEVSVDFRRQVHDEDAITEYEQKFMDLGQPIYRAVWKKEGI